MKRHVNPSKAAAAAMGGFYSQFPEPDRKTCAECGDLRSSFDSSGVCAFCRTIEKAKRTPAGG